MWDEVKRSCNYAARREAAEAFNKANRWRKRGLAIVPTKFGISFTATFMNQAGALVHVHTDGSVLVTHGGTEMGQGLHTKMAAVAARALRIPIEQVHISETSTSTVANSSPTAASASSDLYGMAVYRACKTIDERLQPFREAKPEGSFTDWVNAAYFERVDLSAHGFYKTPDLGYDWDSNTGRPFDYFCYGAAAAEVEIDTLSGDSEVLWADVVMDVGASLNPAIDIGQVEGAFVQGMGLFALEREVWSPKGRLMSRGPGFYKLPGFKNIPIDFKVGLLRNAPNCRAVHSSKAVGEVRGEGGGGRDWTGPLVSNAWMLQPPFFLGSSVFYAIKDAITAARAENGIPVSETFRLDSPATPDRIRMACADRFARHILEQTKDAKGQRWDVDI